MWWWFWLGKQKWLRLKLTPMLFPWPKMHTPKAAIREGKIRDVAVIQISGWNMLVISTRSRCAWKKKPLSLSLFWLQDLMIANFYACMFSQCLFGNRNSTGLAASNWRPRQTMQLGTHSPPLPPPPITFRWVAHVMGEPMGGDQRQRWQKWRAMPILPLPCIWYSLWAEAGWEFGS